MSYQEGISQYSDDAKAASSYFKREFQLCYQPVVALESQGLHSFETLVSWQRDRAQLYSSNLVALVEHSHLDMPFHQWVFYEACRQLKVWQVYCLADAPLCLSINLSARQLACENIAKSIRQVMNEIGVTPAHLQLEIPAKWIVQNELNARSMITQLKRTGASICVDDFDPTDISREHLGALSIDTLKVSGGYAHQLPHNVQVANLLEETISAASKKNIKVIPKGIDTPDQLIAARELGCIYGQGELFLEPVISREATTLISSQVENQPKELMAYLIAMNALSQLAQQFLGKTLVSKYWKETKPKKPWLALLEPYRDRGLLLRSTRSTKLDIAKQQDLRNWTRQFIQRCDFVIREFSQLLAQENFTSSEGQLLKKLWLIAH